MQIKSWIHSLITPVMSLQMERKKENLYGNIERKKICEMYFPLGNVMERKKRKIDK